MDDKHLDSSTGSTGKQPSPVNSTDDKVPPLEEPVASNPRTNADGFASLPRLRKNLLYAVIAIAMATDTLGTSCLFVSTEEIARDMDLAEGGNAIWIISGYAMAFAACIPLGGRLCDVLPAQWWFLGGFVGMTGLTLGNSFVDERKAFLALRALQGICAAFTLPSGFSMVVHMFPNKEEQHTRLIGCSVIWSFGTISGFIIGGVLSLAHWRWIFRFLACTSLAGAVLGWMLMPRPVREKSPLTTSPMKSAVSMLKRFDLIGVVLIMATLLLFNLALTSATVHGWQHPTFIAPFAISLSLLPCFCWWEAKQDERYAMIPVAIMKEAEFMALCYTGLCAEMWFTIAQLGPSRYFQAVLQDSSIVVAGKLSAQIVGAIIGGLFHTFYLSKRVPAQYRLLAGMFGGIIPGLTLLIVSDGGRGMDYWKYVCPGYFTGAIAMVIVFQVCNVLIIQSVPPEYSGIGSSVFQMFAQTGIVIGSSVQAALYTATPNGLRDWTGNQYGFYFMICCLAVAMVMVVLFIRKTSTTEDEFPESHEG